MTRSSTPSKRPASSSAPGPAASSAASAWRQRLAARRQVDQRRIGFLGLGGIDGGGQHVGAHHHAGAAAGRRIVDGAMPADAELADGYRAQRPQAGLQRPADERDAERSREHLRKQRQHRRPPGRSAVACGDVRHAYSLNCHPRACPEDPTLSGLDVCSLATKRRLASGQGASVGLGPRAKPEDDTLVHVPRGWPRRRFARDDSVNRQTPSTMTMCNVPAPWRAFLASAYSADLA